MQTSTLNITSQPLRYSSYNKRRRVIHQSCVRKMSFELSNLFIKWDKSSSDGFFIRYNIDLLVKRPCSLFQCRNCVFARKKTTKLYKLRIRSLFPLYSTKMKKQVQYRKMDRQCQFCCLVHLKKIIRFSAANSSTILLLRIGWLRLINKDLEFI